MVEREKAQGYFNTYTILAHSSRQFVRRKKKNISALTTLHHDIQGKPFQLR
jgi:hypothetical protein